ncbi:hypothetical protein G7081_04915 [Vagococcus coleopterorum]|uniref:DUF937 domain-containing protein n=1 Tax=Vagococcus coleopterorum TaxID=2714946 RepID=A0A6G8AN79_9ENTE|nr:hypothetical protein [Vagococcus coleopterorum]QIL46456.1 hypothetical protein G7081_04915 [Vagococcus coleopterorum]
MGLLTDLLGATGLDQNKQDIYLNEAGPAPAGSAQESIQNQLETLDKAARGIPLEAGQKAAIDITDLIKEAAKKGQTKVEYEAPDLGDILGSIFGQGQSPKVEQHRQSGGLGDILGDILGGKPSTQQAPKTPDLGDILGGMFGGNQTKVQEQKSGMNDVFGDILGQLGKELTQKGAKTQVNGNKMNIDITDILGMFK